MLFFPIRSTLFPVSVRDVSGKEKAPLDISPRGYSYKEFGALIVEKTKMPSNSR